MDIQFPQILFQLINFSVVVGGVVYLLYKPIQKILDERMSKIEEGQKAAEKSIQEKAKLSELKVASEKETVKESAEIMAVAKKKADQQAKDILAKAKAEAQQELGKMKTAWEQEKKTMLQKEKKNMAEAVYQAVYAVSKQKVDSKADEKLVSEELDKVLAKI